MGKGSEQIFLQRRYTNVQQTNKKMFNIISHQGKANKNHNAIYHYTPTRINIIKKSGNNSVGDNVGNEGNKNIPTTTQIKSKMLLASAFLTSDRSPSEC